MNTNRCRTTLGTLMLIGSFVFSSTVSAFADDPVDPMNLDQWTRHKVGETALSVESWEAVRGPIDTDELLFLIDPKFAATLTERSVYQLSGQVALEDKRTGFMAWYILTGKSNGAVRIQDLKGSGRINKDDKIIKSERVPFSGIEGDVETVKGGPSSLNMKRRIVYLFEGDRFWVMDLRYFDKGQDPLINRFINSIQMAKESQAPRSPSHETQIQK